MSIFSSPLPNHLVPGWCYCTLLYSGCIHSVYCSLCIFVCLPIFLFFNFLTCPCGRIVVERSPHCTHTDRLISELNILIPSDWPRPSSSFCLDLDLDLVLELSGVYMDMDTHESMVGLYSNVSQGLEVICYTATGNGELPSLIISEQKTQNAFYAVPILYFFSLNMAETNPH